MAIPDFQSLMLPLLKLAGDQQEHTLAEASELLANEFRLTQAERSELLPGSRQTKIGNGVGWAAAYLRKAGLLESTGRGRFRITQHGLGVLESPPPRITVGFLKQFNEFLEFRDVDEAKGDIYGEYEKTPEEFLEAGYQELRGRLTQDLLEVLKTCSHRVFQKAIVELLHAMGYGGSKKELREVFAWISDNELDGVIKEDSLGLGLIYVQARRDQEIIQRPLVQSFAGSLEGFGADKGVLISTASFSNDARDYVLRIRKQIVLINGETLAQLMVDYGVGIDEIARYVIAKVDWSFFEDD